MYRRVLPRDLFNEANLLKCLGQISLKIHDGLAPAGLAMIHSDPTQGFRINMDVSSGDIYCPSLVLQNAAGFGSVVARNLNSRDSWPVYIVDEDEDEVAVFDEAGDFTPAFVNWAKS